MSPRAIDLQSTRRRRLLEHAGQDADRFVEVAPAGSDLCEVPERPAERFGHPSLLGERDSLPCVRFGAVELSQAQLGIAKALVSSIERVCAAKSVRARSPRKRSCDSTSRPRGSQNH